MGFSFYNFYFLPFLRLDFIKLAHNKWCTDVFKVGTRILDSPFLLHQTLVRSKLSQKVQIFSSLALNPVSEDFRSQRPNLNAERPFRALKMETLNQTINIWLGNSDNWSWIFFPHFHRSINKLSTIKWTCLNRISFY